MKITITFDHKELLTIIEGMLSVKGMRPTEPIAFYEVKDGKKYTGTYAVKVTCEESEIVDRCPMCARSLSAPHTALVGDSDDTETTPHTGAATVSRHASGTGTTEDTVTLDASLEESLEPPTPPTRSTKLDEDGGGGGMASILAASRALEAQKAREKGRHK